MTLLKGDSRYAALTKPSSDLKPKHVYFFEKSTASHLVIVQYCDMTIEAHLIDNGAEKRLWKR